MEIVPIDVVYLRETSNCVERNIFDNKIQPPISAIMKNLLLELM